VSAKCCRKQDAACSLQSACRTHREISWRPSRNVSRKDVLIVDNHAHVVAELALLGQDLVDGLLGADVKTLVARVNGNETFDLASHEVHLELKVGLVGDGRVLHGRGGQQRLRTGGVLAELLGLALLAHVEAIDAGENALGVEVFLLHGSDDAGVNTLDNIVSEKISLRIVDRVLCQVGDGGPDLAVLGGDALVVEARLDNNRKARHSRPKRPWSAKVACQG
jgi:hypothetical protein